MADRSGTSADDRIAARDTPTDPRGDWLDRWCVALATAYPHGHAEGWDQVGLHVGDPDRDLVTGVLVALDVTEAVLDEAARVGADLVIAHHPLLFQPLDRLTTRTAAGRIALKAARQGCAVLAAHTNVDKAVDGTSHPAAEVLGLIERRPLRAMPPAPDGAPVKIVTFVPRTHTDEVISAMAAAGAGVIGDYSGCAFVTAGTGTFRPGPHTSPMIGTPGEHTEVAEDRVEMVVREVDARAVLQQLRQAHPYEEVPVDRYPLVDDRPSANTGLGIVGRLPEPTPLRQVARALAEGLPSPHLRLATNDPERLVRDVAICGGAGDSLIGDLITGKGRPRVDLFVTGDLKHHPTVDALAMGLSLIDAGHFATEDPAMDAVVTRLEQQRDREGLTAPIHRSRVNTDPWTDWRTPR